MVKAIKDQAASIRQRPLNLSRSDRIVFEVVLINYGLERLIYRLSVSQYREQFVLKGGMLVTLWTQDPNRVTRDADFLGHGDPDMDHLKSLFTEIIDFPSLLDFPTSTIRAYSPATVVAEKFRAMVALGLANSRMKDYYDLWAMNELTLIEPNEFISILIGIFAKRSLWAIFL